MHALRSRYGEPWRHYHTWDHIDALLGQYGRWEDRFHRPVPVLWALYWHDAVYDPKGSDNEEKSAQLLEAEAAGHLPPSDIAFAAAIIRATAGHEIPDGMTGADAEDTGLFLDIDLSYLAAPKPVFEQAQDRIRAEYAYVPDDTFRKARAGILKGFLDRERLYLTDIAHAEWDAAARTNLARAIRAMEAA